MARKKYDAEVFVKDVVAYMKANINDRIEKINIEKDDFAIDTINENAYIFQSLNDKIINNKSTIFYYIDDIASEGIDSATSEDISLDVCVILSDKKDGNLSFALLRYLRVLKELFNEGFNNINYSKKVQVESLTPISFSLINSSNYVYAIGVRITTTII